MKRKLCLFTDSLEPSGVGEQMLCFAAELRHDFHISFICPPTPAGMNLLDRARSAGAEVLALRALGAREAAARLGGWLKAKSVDIFHCHAGIAWEGHEGVRIARSSGIPLVFRTEHLPHVLNEPAIVSRYLKMLESVDHVACVSQKVCESFLSGGAPASKLSVVRNGINPRHAEPDRERLISELELPGDAYLVLTVGRMTEQKGYSFLLEAIPEIVAGEPRAHFIWVGTGPEQPQLEKRARELGVERHIHFAGRRHDVPLFIASSDLFVLPSLFEGMPLVVLEAMAAGLPVIGTRVSGTSEEIVDGLTGRLVDPSSVEGLARGVLEAASEPQRAAGWARAARRRFQDEFRAARMAREMKALYYRLLAERRQPAQPASEVVLAARSMVSAE